MDEIGELLKNTREETGISLEEASNDLEIKPLILENIEAGNIGCFKDIFVLKDYICNYAKYLGLDYDKVIDKFNEYLFEYTSKIPMEDIEKAMEEQKKEETSEMKIVSPYTTTVKEEKNKWIIFVYIALALLVILVVILSIRQITVSNKASNVIYYHNK